MRLRARPLRLPLLMGALLLALPAWLPAPMSEQEIGLRQNMTPEEEARAMEDWHRRDDAAQAEVARQRAEEVRAAQVARVARTTIPPEVARQIAARNAAPSSSATATAAQVTPAQATPDRGGKTMAIALAIAVLGWGIWIVKRYASSHTAGTGPGVGA